MEGQPWGKCRVGQQMRGRSQRYWAKHEMHHNYSLGGEIRIRGNSRRSGGETMSYKGGFLPASCSPPFLYPYSTQLLGELRCVSHLV